MGIRITKKAAQPAIPHGTYYWSCSPDNFVPIHPDTDDIYYRDSPAFVKAEADYIWLQAPVFLPHGAIVIAVIIYGNASASAEDWVMRRTNISTGVTSGMGAANINTEDTSIGLATIDNTTYAYFFRTSNLFTNDEIWGARITYTL